MSSLLTPAKNVIITGGASGIGFAISRFFLANYDANVFIFDVDFQQGNGAIKSLLAQFPKANVKFKLCDISSWEAQERTFEEVYIEQGNINLVVANAGISERGSLLNLDGVKPSRPDLSTLSVNLTGTIYTIKLASHYFQKAAANDVSGQCHNGSIICTASVAGIYPFPTAPIYSASKHAIIGLVRSLARPLALRGISINALAPNVIETNIAASSQLFETMHLTPMSTMIKAINILVDNRSLTGKVLLISGDEVEFIESLPEGDDDVRHNIEQFWKLGYS